MMSLALHILITKRVLPGRGMHLTEVTIGDESVPLQLMTTAPAAACPLCHVPSSSIHSHYQRHLTHLPWGTRPVRIHLMVRKFVCRNPTCARRIFTERLPDLVAPSARNTHQLITVLRAIGIALGGQAGARLAARLQRAASAATLLRLVRRPQCPRLQPSRPSA
jgi:transposase